MSHTWISADGITVVHHNSDLSGDCELLSTRVPERRILVPCEALLELVAHWVRRDREVAMRDATSRALLGMQESSDYLEPAEPKKVCSGAERSTDGRKA